MSKQNITEQELLAKVAKLYEHMDQSVEEGWWGDNMPEFLGGDPAKAPMKLPVTPKNYARVQKMLPAMYKAAQVDPNADDVIKQRYGVYLPPFEKWDGTVPSGHADFLTRNVFGRDASKAAEEEGTKAQEAELARQQRIEANAKKLSDLFAKLQELVPAAFEKKEEPAAPAQAQATPVKESLAESMKRLSLMLSEAEEAKPADAAPAEQTTKNPAEEVIKEIEATIAAIEADDPDDEDIEMINIVKEKVAQCQNILKQEAEQNPAAPAGEEGSFDSFGNPVKKGSAAATSADPTGQVEKDRIADRMDAEAGANPVGQGATVGGAAGAQKPMTWQEIYDLNKSIIGDNPNLIKPGQMLELPNGMGKYTVVPGDNLTIIAQGRGKGKYETNVVPQQPDMPPKPAAPQFTPKVTPPTVTPPFKKEMPADWMKNYYNLPGPAPQKSTTGTYQHLDVSDPKIKAMQAAADKDPNNASFRTTIREDETLARIVNLVKYGK